jgi:predicted acyltransferase
LIAAGLVLHFTGACPIVKRIWTPSWVLFSGGICFLFLALFSWWIDIKGHRRFVFPFIVVGTNSIAAYLIAHLSETFLTVNLYTNLGHRPFQIFGVLYEPLLMGTSIMLIYWLALYWMFKNQVYLRI